MKLYFKADLRNIRSESDPNTAASNAQPIPEDVITSSKDEVSSKSKSQIEYETSVQWGARAIASYILATQFASVPYFILAEDYMHEAIEHCGQIRDHGATLARLQKQIDEARATCRRSLGI